MHKELIKVIIRQAKRYDKQETLPKGVRVAGLLNLTSPKRLEINYFHV